ncbi:MAG: hypothetical protein ACK401_03635 [Archaeoglobaceae archaeon]
MNERVAIALLKNEFQGLKIKEVFEFLYSDREILRFKSAEALGVLCKGDVAYNYILRLFWHLSDESGAYCIGAPLAIAEIGLRNPNIFEGFKLKYLYLLDNEEIERSYVAYGILRSAKVYEKTEARDLLRKKLLELGDPRFKAYAILALRKMGEKVEVPSINARISFYNGKEIVEISFSEILDQHL